MAEDYKIHLTDLAAARCYGKPQELMDVARKEVDKLVEGDLKAPLDLIMHVFTVNDQDYIAYPKDGVIEVDTCFYEDMPPLKDGPFKGRVWSMPYAESGRIK